MEMDDMESHKKTSLRSYMRRNMSTRSLKILAKLNFRTGLGTDSKLDVVLWLLKFFGNCPLSNSGNTQKFYFLKWSSPFTVLSLCAALYFSFTYFVFITHVTFKKYFLFEEGIRKTFTKFEAVMEADTSLPHEKVHSTLEQVKGLTLYISMHSVVVILLSWHSSTKLAEYLNNWIPIQKVFAYTFPEEEPQHCKADPEPTPGSTKGFTFGLCLYIILLGVIPFCFVARVLDYDSCAAQTWVIFTVSAHYGITETLEDAKNVLIYRSLSDAFEQTRACIRKRVQRESPDEFKVQAWRQFLKQLQNQCELAGNCLMPNQLAFLFNTLLSGTTCVYVSLNGVGSSRMSVMICLMCASLCALWLGRLYFKVLMAEKITEAEALISKDLIQMDTAHYSAPVLSQIRLTFDAIVHYPSGINFGNYVILNKQLFLGIIVQVITYLVVLMQLFQVNLPRI